MSKETNVYLIGPMGSGKSAVGRQLAKELGRKFIDTDAEIERRTGVDISFIFEKEGEARFREREKEVVADTTALDNVVVATGGGVVLDTDNRNRLASAGTIVYLKVGIEQQLARTGQSRHRPLLAAGDPRGVLEQLAAVRGPLYEEIADIVLDTSGKRVRTVVDAVCRLLKQRGTAAG
jgi:shikimate kinase